MKFRALKMDNKPIPSQKDCYTRSSTIAGPLFRILYIVEVASKSLAYTLQAMADLKSNANIRNEVGLVPNWTGELRLDCHS